jgi:hypothetical protein
MEGSYTGTTALFGRRFGCTTTDFEEPVSQSLSPRVNQEEENEETIAEVKLRIHYGYAVADAKGQQ